MEALNMASPFPHEDYITRGEVELRFEIVDNKISAVEKRMDKLEAALNEVVCLQKEMNQKITYSLILAVVMLLGILLGRGLDFGMFLR